MDEYFERGDEVFHKLTGWFGIVTDVRKHGLYVEVTFGPIAQDSLPFALVVDDVLLEFAGEIEDPESKDAPVTEENVINFVEFKAKKLTKKTPTKGAA